MFKARRADYLWLAPLPTLMIPAAIFQPAAIVGTLMFAVPTIAAFRGKKWGFGALAWLYFFTAIAALANGGIVWFLWVAMIFWYLLSRIESWPKPEPVSECGVE